jgi:hypothetical protein
MLPGTHLDQPPSLKRACSIAVNLYTVLLFFFSFFPFSLHFHIAATISVKMAAPREAAGNAKEIDTLAM